jgi:hypothetical protein
MEIHQQRSFMSNNKFIMVGKLIRTEDYDGTPSILTLVIDDSPPDQSLYGLFILITDKPEKGGVHTVIAVPEAANAGYSCIQRGSTALVMGSVRSFDKTPMLLATYITCIEPNNYVMQLSP